MLYVRSFDHSSYMGFILASLGFVAGLYHSVWRVKLESRKIELGLQCFGFSMAQGVETAVLGSLRRDKLLLSARMPGLSSAVSDELACRGLGFVLRWLLVWIRPGGRCL